MSQSPVSPGYEVCTEFTPCHTIRIIFFYEYQCQCEEMHKFNQISILQS